MASNWHHKSTRMMLCIHLVPTLDKRCSQPALPLVHWHLIQIVQGGQASHQALTVGPAGSQSVFSVSRPTLRRLVNHWLPVGQNTACRTTLVSRCVDTSCHLMQSACQMHISAWAAAQLAQTAAEPFTVSRNAHCHSQARAGSVPTEHSFMRTGLPVSFRNATSMHANWTQFTAKHVPTAGSCSQHACSIGQLTAVHISTAGRRYHCHHACWPPPTAC